MSVQFPPGPGFSGFNAPLRMEADIHDIEIEGAIPADLNGHFLSRPARLLVSATICQ